MPTFYIDSTRALSFSKAIDSFTYVLASISHFCIHYFYTTSTRGIWDTVSRIVSYFFTTIVPGNLKSYLKGKVMHICQWQDQIIDSIAAASHQWWWYKRQHTCGCGNPAKVQVNLKVSRSCMNLSLNGNSKYGFLSKSGYSTSISLNTFLGLLSGSSCKSRDVSATNQAKNSKSPLEDTLGKLIESNIATDTKN